MQFKSIYPNLTTSAKTLENYFREGKHLFKRFQSKYNSIDVNKFVKWLDILFYEKAPATRRHYRLGAQQYLLNTNHPKADKALEFLESIRFKEYPRVKVKHTVGKKIKKFPFKDFKYITDYLLYITSDQKSKILRDWLIVGIFTGIRPIEMKSIRLDGTDMRVKNGKNSNGRANGDFRTLHLNGYPKFVLDAISRMQVCVQYHDDFHGLYTAIRKHLSSVCRKLWSNRVYSLYSCRHQFIADRKAGGYTTKEIAALVGHSSDFTATLHYAKGRSAWAKGTLRPQPDEANMENVRHSKKLEHSMNYINKLRKQEKKLDISLTPMLD